MSHNSRDILGEGVLAEVRLCHDLMENWQGGKYIDAVLHVLTCSFTDTSHGMHTATCEFKYSLTVKASHETFKTCEGKSRMQLLPPDALIPGHSSSSYSSWACIQKKGQSLTCTGPVNTFVHVSLCMVRVGGRQPCCEPRSQNSTAHPVVIL